MPEINGNSVPRRKPVPLRSVRSTPILRDHEDSEIPPPKYEDLFRIGPYDADRILNHKEAPQPELVEEELVPGLEKQVKNLVLVTEEDYTLEHVFRKIHQNLLGIVLLGIGTMSKAQ